MAYTFEELVNDMVNIGFGAVATAAEKSKEVLDGLNTKGAEVRSDTSNDFARSMSDILARAGAAMDDARDRFGASGTSAAEHILDELILARVRPLTIAERTAFLAHVRDLVDSCDDAAVTVPIESVEPEDAPEKDAEPADEDAAAPDADGKADA